VAFKYERLRVVTDSRGAVFEPVDSSEVKRYKNAHVVISAPGVIRGNHFHEIGEETMAVMGPALVRTKEGAETTDTEVPAGEVYQFIYKTGVSHAIKNLSDQSNVLMAFNTIEHDPQNPDTVKDDIL
jgi:dTDP-4-dehydrorhamnose 3,5-epimerase-like enzyme